MNSMIEIDNLTIYYGNNNRALENISLKINEHDFLGIVGQNGSGKSTLLKSILDLVPITSGTVLFNGSKKNTFYKIGYVPQYSSMNMTFPITSLDAVCLGLLGKGLHPFKFIKPEQREVSIEKMKLLQVDHLANRQLSELSGGEFQRILIARALAIEPDILILDEPTASIDSNSRKLIFELLKKLKEEKKMTILLVSHDLQDVLDLSTHIICLNNKVKYYGLSNLTVEDINNYCNK